MLQVSDIFETLLKRKGGLNKVEIEDESVLTLLNSLNIKSTSLNI